LILLIVVVSGMNLVLLLQHCRPVRRDYPHCHEVLPPNDRLRDVLQDDGDDGVKESALLNNSTSHSRNVDLGPVRCAEAHVGLLDLASVLCCCAEG
jgi:hypothetical protein